jgi:SHS2 domain-containing protein
MISEGGYREIAHTADWELETWASDLAGLMVQAVLGMQSLAGLELERGLPTLETIMVEGDDPESLFVGLLAELLYIQESRKLGVEQLMIQVNEKRIVAETTFQRALLIRKEIKAVTWHHLKIENFDGGVITRIVFDV